MYAGAEGELVRKEEGTGETGGEVERREGGRRCWGKQEGGRGSLGSRLRGICAYRVWNVRRIFQMKMNSFNTFGNI